MMNQFSPKVSEILSFSREEAKRLTSKSVAPEHIMLAILREKSGPVWDLFNRWEVDTDYLKKEIENKIKEENVGAGEAVSDLLLSVLEARLQHAQTVDIIHIFLAILHDSSNNAAKTLLEERGLSYNNVTAMLKPHANPTRNGIGMAEEEELDDEEMSPSSSAKNTKTTQATRTKSKTPILDSFGTDLTQAALEGKLDPVVGREREIMRVS